MKLGMTTNCETCTECGATVERLSYCTGCDARCKVMDAAMDPDGDAPALHPDDARLVEIALALRSRPRRRAALRKEECELRSRALASGRWRNTDWAQFRR